MAAMLFPVTLGVKAERVAAMHLEISDPNRKTFFSKDNPTGGPTSATSIF